MGNENKTMIEGRLPSSRPRLMLADESGISAERMVVRESIYRQLKAVPLTMLEKTQIIQPETGCLNGCSICSQHSATRLIQMTAEGFEDFSASLKEVMEEIYPDRVLSGAPLIGFSRPHKPGVVYPYLDNDTATSNEWLDRYVEVMGRDFNALVRLSTVGFSRKNETIVKAHERIAGELGQYVAGLRISVSPYPLGFNVYDGEMNQYFQDLSVLLRIYRPWIEKYGTGREKASLDLRFPLNLEIPDRPLTVEAAGDHQIVRCGSYAFVTSSWDNDRLEETELVDVVDRKPVYDKPGMPAMVIVSDQLPGMSAGEIMEALSSLQMRIGTSGRMVEHAGKNFFVRPGLLHKFSNLDGEYYSVDPVRKNDGRHDGIHLYPLTEKRRVSGVLNATRMFQNLLLQYRTSQGMENDKYFANASWDNVAEFLYGFSQHAVILGDVSGQERTYLNANVIPVIRMIASALREAEYPPGYFFNSSFVRDTGPICNMGRAFPLFKGIVSTPDIPSTPNEAKSDIDSAAGGPVVRIAPMHGDKVSIAWVSALGLKPELDSQIVIDGIKTGNVELQDAIRRNLRLGY